MEIITRQTLVADEGMCFINAHREENEEVVPVRIIELGEGRTKEDYIEITIAEGIALQAEVNARLMAQMQQEMEV